MKKTILFFSALASIIGFVACSNEDDSLIEQSEQSQSQTGKMTFWATAVLCSNGESNTKVTRTQFAANSTFDVEWSKEDNIYIMDKTLKKYSLSESDGGNGLFEGEQLTKSNSSRNNVKYTAYYGIEGTSSLFPNVQSFDNKKVSYVPMSATVEVNNQGVVAKDVTFTSLCGLLRITIKGPNTKKIKSITVSDGVKKMAGAISAIDDFLQINQTNGSTNSITLDCGVNGVALNPNGTDFYIAIPVAYITKTSWFSTSIEKSKYDSFKIAITDDKDETITKQMKDGYGLNVTQSEITSITFNNLYQNKFEGGEVDVTGTTEKFDRTTLDDSAWSSL